MTACVWVGYADTTTPMTTLYNGGPVMGGTFPALIWASVISAWEEIKAERAAEAKEDRESKADEDGSGSSSSGSTYTAPESSGETEAEAANRKKANRANPWRPKQRRKRPNPPNRRNPPRANPPRPRAAAASPPDKRLRHVGVVGGAEAPGPLDRFGDADPRAR